MGIDKLKIFDQKMIEYNYEIKLNPIKNFFMFSIRMHFLNFLSPSVNAHESKFFFNKTDAFKSE